MKPTPFPGNGRGLYVEHHRTREGSNYFVICYRNSSRCISDADPKNVWRELGVAKYTETGKALKEWAVETAEKCLPKPELDKTKLLAEGFGPEAHEELSEDPTAHTKMIT